MTVTPAPVADALTSLPAPSRRVTVALTYVLPTGGRMITSPRFSEWSEGVSLATGSGCTGGCLSEPSKPCRCDPEMVAKELLFKAVQSQMDRLLTERAVIVEEADGGMTGFPTAGVIVTAYATVSDINSHKVALLELPSGCVALVRSSYDAWVVRLPDDLDADWARHLWSTDKPARSLAAYWCSDEGWDPSALNGLTGFSAERIAVGDLAGVPISAAWDAWTEAVVTSSPLRPATRVMIGQDITPESGWGTL